MHMDRVKLAVLQKVWVVIIVESHASLLFLAVLFFGPCCLSSWEIAGGFFTNGRSTDLEVIQVCQSPHHQKGPTSMHDACEPENPYLLGVSLMPPRDLVVLQSTLFWKTSNSIYERIYEPIYEVIALLFSARCSPHPYAPSGTISWRLLLSS
jgi:hypothetical protein